MNDKLFPVGDGATNLKLADVGDLTVARVVKASVSNAPTAGDKVVAVGDGTTKKRLRDMGDGTNSEVFYGVI